MNRLLEPVAVDAPAVPDIASVSLGVFAEQVRLLYHLSLIGYLATLLVALVLGTALSSELAHLGLFAWIALIAVLTSGRYVLYKVYIAASPPAEQAQRWLNYFIVGSGLMGLAWAIMGTALFPTENTFYQMTVLLLVALLCTGAVAECAPNRAAFMVYVLPALIPMALHLLLLGGKGQILGAVVLLLTANIFYIHHKANQAVKASLTSRFKNITLATHLSAAEHKVESSYQALEQESAERKRAEEAERQAVQRLQLHVEQTPLGVIEWDVNFKVTDWNTAAERIFGYSRGEALGNVGDEFLVPESARERVRHVWNDLLARRGGAASRNENVTRGGRAIVCEWFNTPLVNQHDQVIGVASLVQDVTERTANEEIVFHMAHHDPLTGLPNRRLLKDRLEQAILNAQRHHHFVAVLYIDLDRFKVINDTLGHFAGDAVLRTVTRRLTESVRGGDTVAREGGDEFVVALASLEKAEDAHHVSHKLQEQLAKPHVFEGQEFHVTASIGISSYPADAQDAQSLLKHADLAMYEAKHQGRNTMRLYSNEMEAMLSRRLLIETRLRNGLERGEFVLYYQPQIDLASGAVCAAEALLRWHGEGVAEAMYPDQMIPVAEEIGVIASIGQWVLRTACEQKVSWQKSGLGNFQVSVNISTHQFAAGGLLESVKAALLSTGLDPRQLELEITETMVKSDPEHAQPILNELKGMGIALALDDFGTGHSSLGQLNRFPMHTLKIDPVFLRGIPMDRDVVAITQAILAMARSLGLRVVAVGVETQEQLNFLREHGCDAIQGYVFSPPLTAPAFEALLRSGKSLRQETSV